jgi:hypothetical protein
MCLRLFADLLPVIVICPLYEGIADDIFDLQMVLDLPQPVYRFDVRFPGCGIAVAVSLANAIALEIGGSELEHRIEGELRVHLLTKIRELCIGDLGCRKGIGAREVVSHARCFEKSCIGVYTLLVLEIGRSDSVAIRGMIRKVHSYEIFEIQAKGLPLGGKASPGESRVGSPKGDHLSPLR